LLVELICIDLEFRWHRLSESQPSQQQAFLETYAARYPELGSLDQLPIEIIGQEYRVRHQWGDRPTHSDFLSRFAARRESIREELARIDSELREESAVPRSHSPGGAGFTAIGTEIEQNLGIPLLSHHDVLLRRMIGSGRMGKVFEAWQHNASRLVAVKFLRKSFLSHPGVVERFIGEAGIIAKLRHANIVGIHGLGRTSGGAYFIVMELVAGLNLDVVIKAGAIPVEQAVRWVIEVCNALEHSHTKGIIHCDLKPANLLLDGDGRLRVTDFGLARSLTEHTLWTTEIEGTAPYMAPEQAARYWGRIDVHTDVYGVGAVLFTLLTGRPPWVGRRLPDILADVISAAPVIPPMSLRPDLRQSLSDVCRKCLSKACQERYRTAREVREALTDIVDRNC
jgi:eukaryotic-like serine/threonine-protein kinase